MPRKGADFELEIAKKLSLWFTEGKRDDLVCRTDASGGRATIRTKSKKETNPYLYGDLKHSDDTAKPLFDVWSIECKTGYASKNKLKDGTKKVVNWDILDLLDSKQDETAFAKMWNQCVTDAELSSRTPILIFRRDQKEPLLVITKEYYEMLQLYFGLFEKMIMKIDLSKLFWPYGQIIIIKFADFLKWASPEAITQFSENKISQISSSM